MQILSHFSEALVQQTKPIIIEILTNLKNKTWDSSKFTFKRQSSSNLTHKAGLYLIVNNKTNKIYLGSSSNLAQRKGEHNNYLSNPQKAHKLSPLIQKDLETGNKDDFFFVPLTGVDSSNLTNSSLDLKLFFDLEIESRILEDFLNPNSILGKSNHTSFYNQKTIGVFQKDNPYGGHPKSGLPKKPICFENYAWESISGSARCLGVTPKTIRNKLKEFGQQFKVISPVEFSNFNGVIINDLTGFNYFETRQDELKVLKKKLNLK